jgi:primosomal protein N' (replication factor Y)
MSSKIDSHKVCVMLPIPISPTNDGKFDYRITKDLELSLGDFVSVPFGSRSAIGVVWGKASGHCSDDKLKNIHFKLDCPPLPEVSRHFVEWVSRYTVSSPGAVLKMVMSVPDALKPPKIITTYKINKIPDVQKITTTRKRVIDLLNHGSPMLVTDIIHEAGVSSSVVKGLIKGGSLIEVKSKPKIIKFEYNLESKNSCLKLSKNQIKASTILENTTEAASFSVTLLDGVPGSGKTEVYFQAVAKALEMGGQVLVLLPEISLSSQWLARFRDRFGGDPEEWHSEMTPARRRKTWRAVLEGHARVVVGARSALFLPFSKLTLIIVDEEHDTSFKQEEGVIYNARDMAVVRAQLGSIPIVLASATPALETLLNTEHGRYQTLQLPDRYGTAKPPVIETIDMRAEKMSLQSWISPTLQKALSETFSEKEQAMLFLNRRGYAPLTLCRTCGHRLQCPSCSAWLVEHRQIKKLQCHHCGYNANLPNLCPDCKNKDSFAACGPGVERLEEEVTGLFPGIRTIIAASDNIAGPKAAAELVRKIEKHEVDLIIGTQIVAKGYHFPMLTLVGAVDADLGLTGGDLRAAERTHQLLYQVAGRAGRSTRPGRVIIQTYMPEHPVMNALQGGERITFMAAEAESRRKAEMPPFGRLAAIIVSAKSEEVADDYAAHLSRIRPSANGISVLGPAPAPMALLRGRHRRRLLLKTTKKINIQGVIRDWLAVAEVSKKVRVQIDIDPYSFL